MGRVRGVGWGGVRVDVEELTFFVKNQEKKWGGGGVGSGVRFGG